jgi:HAD superfamily hydrolase (TIGR01450 family)
MSAVVSAGRIGAEAYDRLVPLSPLVAGYDNLILDMDGCVWVGEDPTPRAVEAIAEARQAGKAIAYVTNNPRRSPEEYVTKLWGLGIQASAADIVTVGGAMQHLLAETRHGRTAFVIGGEALRKHVTDAGLKVMNGTDLATRVDVVVVGPGEEMSFEDLRCASLAARRGGDLLATSRDPTYPMPDGLWPGTGAILAAVETASDRTAAIVGKPEPQLILTALDRLPEGRTLMVGDRLDTDIVAAGRAGVDAALVLTGGAVRADAEAAEDPKPVAVADNLAELLLSSTASA